jgi:hypothetical protein
LDTAEYQIGIGQAEERLEQMTEQWNTPLDDFEAVLHKMLARGRSAPEILPTEPPVELIQEYHAANRVAEYLAQQQVYLHFAVAADGEQVQVQILGKDGHTMGEISPLRLLESLSAATTCYLTRTAEARALYETDRPRGRLAAARDERADHPPSKRGPRPQITPPRCRRRSSA